MDKIISIIIPCYNSEELLDHCFTSIREQTLGMDKLEVVFINDASTDATLDKLLNYEKRFPESVIVINSPVNKKQNGARNLGLERATGTYVMFVNADDWVKPQLCETLYKIAQEYDTDIIQHPCIYYFSETVQEQEEGLRYGVLNADDRNIKRELLIGMYMTFGSQNKFYKHSLIQKVGARFVEQLACEEASFVYPLLFEAKKLYCMSESMYYCRQSSVTGIARANPDQIYDRPKAQLHLLKEISTNQERTNTFYNEIEFYFLYTYYVETVYLAGSQNLALGIDYFEGMQKLVQELFPEYEQNPYLKLSVCCNVMETLKSVHKKFTQQELVGYCEWVARQLECSRKNNFMLLREVENEMNQQIAEKIEQDKLKTKEWYDRFGIHLEEQYQKIDMLLKHAREDEAKSLLAFLKEDEFRSAYAYMDSSIAQMYIILSIYGMELSENVAHTILEHGETMRELIDYYLSLKFQIWRVEFEYLSEVEKMKKDCPEFDSSKDGNTKTEMNMIDFFTKNNVSVPAIKYILHTASFDKLNTACRVALLLKKHKRQGQAFAIFSYALELSPGEEVILCEMADICYMNQKKEGMLHCIDLIKKPTGILEIYREKWRDNGE
ncbi:glycosyltransferase [Lachnospiraceae bacterium ZAX-1]